MTTRLAYGERDAKAPKETGSMGAYGPAASPTYRVRRGIGSGEPWFMSPSPIRRDDVSDTRTGPLVGKLVVAVQEDIAEIVGNIQKAREQMAQLEGQTKGINGLSAFLKAQGNSLDKMMQDFANEADDVTKKLVGSPKVEIVEHVNVAHAKAVKAAKESAA